MKILDVDQLQAGLTRNIDRMNRLEQEISAIQKVVEGLTAMEDALKGEGGQAIRDFYTSCHLPFLQYFLAFKEEFNMVLQQAQQALASLEPVDAGHIVEEFLETDVEKGLTESADITAILTDKANAIMDEVSDIIGLSKLDDTLVQENIADARKKRNDTEDALHTFDSTQTNQLTPIETSIQSMKEWVQNIEGLFKEGLTDVDFPSDKWSGIVGNSEIVMKLSDMGMETGIEPQEPLACERPVETDVKEDRAWYEVVGDVIVGVFEGAGKAIADIFTGLYDMLASLFDDPKAFFGNLATAILNPIDTVTQMWAAVETAWERDVINGDARSRAAFFSYTAVSLFGVKGLDKLGKMGKAAGATKKPDNSLPYNAMQTDKLKDTVKSNVTAIIQEKTKQASDFWQSSYAKKAINKTVHAVKNAEVITKVKNTVNPANIKAAAAKTYEDMVKAPIAKTQAAMEEMGEKVASLFGWNNGLVPVGASGNTGWRIEVENVDINPEPDSTFQQIVMDRDGGGEQTKGNAVSDYIDAIIVNGKVDADKMNKLKNAIQNNTFSIVELSEIRKKMSELDIIKEYDEVLIKMDFGKYLRGLIGDPPTAMIDPHAHHILFKKGLGEAQQKLVQEGQEILRKYGIDPIIGQENLVWAPNRVAGQHSIAALENVVNQLKAVDAAGADLDDIIEMLGDLGKQAASRK